MKYFLLNSNKLLSVAEVTVTMKNNFVLASWGNLKVYRFGKLIIVNIWGISRSTTSTSDIAFATITDSSYSTAFGESSLVTAGSNPTKPVQLTNKDIIIGNNFTTNVNYFGQVIGVVTS